MLKEVLEKIAPSEKPEPENRFQEQFGAPVARAKGKVRDYMHLWVQEFISLSPFLVMASSNADGAADASPRGGKPGFVKVLNERQLLLPDVAGNRMFQSYGNIDSNGQVGLIFFIPGIDDTVRVNGKAKVISKDELERHSIDLSVFNPDDNAKNLQGLLIDVVEAYGHCPRALLFSKLWDKEVIGAHQNIRPLPRKPAGV